uniref:EF-hand domain-containing protein n=1 Tax=Neogobius melanostomus TaxID=47308 RepID=A0A8C6U850_9GOBI
MNLAKKLLGGIVNIVSNIDPSDFIPSEPPPARRPLNLAETHESEEEKDFRRVFQQLSGDDLEISPEELKGILDRVIRRNSQLRLSDGGFCIETCRSMVAVMDSDGTGRLGFHEFKYLWSNIKKWQGIFVKNDRDKSGRISNRELPGALAEAGFHVEKCKDDLLNLIIRRYTSQDGDMDFDHYLACLVRLDSMCRAFKTMDNDNDGHIDLDIEEWLQLTMYS